MTTCTCDPSLISADASPWMCPHGNTWRLGARGDPYCWTLVPTFVLDAPLPDDWQAAGAVVIIRAIDGDGQRRMTTRYSGDVMAWEAIGMLRVAASDVERSLTPEPLPERSAS